MKPEFYDDEIRSLKQKVDDLDLIVSCFDDIVFEVNPEGTILNSWASRPQDLFFDREYILNRPIGELFPQQFSGTMLDAIGRTLRDRTSVEVSYESPLERFRGQWFRLRTRILGTRPDRVLIIITNITRERELQQMLRIKEEKFNQAFLHSSVGMALLDARLGVVDFNPELREMLGLGEMGEIGELDLAMIVQREDIRSLYTAAAGLRAKRVEKASLEIKIRSADGKAIWCLVSLSAVRDDRERLVYFVCQLQDITRLKVSRQELTVQKSELENINFELQFRIKQLQTINQVLSHELRSPLANIEMLAGQLKSTLSDSLAKEYLDMITRSGAKFRARFDRVIGYLETLDSMDQRHRWNDARMVVGEAVEELFGDSGEIPVDYREDASQREFCFPARYLKTLIQYSILGSMSILGRGVSLKVTSRKLPGQFVLSIKCSEKDGALGRPTGQIDSMLEELTVDLYIAKHQIQSHGGSASLDQREDGTAVLSVNIPLMP